jgi:hypothetical protein
MQTDLEDRVRGLELSSFGSELWSVADSRQHVTEMNLPFQVNIFKTAEQLLALWNTFYDTLTDTIHACREVYHLHG